MTQQQADKICEQYEMLLNKLHNQFEVTITNRMLRDMLFDFAKETRRQIIEPLRQLYSQFGDDNILIIEASLAGRIHALNEILLPFGAVPFDVSSRMYYADGKIKLIGKF